MTLVRKIKSIVDKQPTATFSFYKENDSFIKNTYSDFWQECSYLALAFRDIGIKRSQHVGIISDNRREWLPIDISLLGIGAVDIPRGNDSTPEEISYILDHGDCEFAVIESVEGLEQLVEFKDQLPKLKHIILIEGNFKKKLPWELSTYSSLIEKGKELFKSEPDFFENEIEKGNIDDLVTIIYTSGTTGEPKGVMLSNRSFLFQIEKIPQLLDLRKKEVFLTVLPIWHSFERSVEYIVLSRGMSIAYSKPIGSIMLADMKELRPHWMTSVPRIWESIRDAAYRKVKKGSAIKQALFNSFVSVGNAHSQLLSMFKGLKPDFTKRILWLDKIVSIIPLILLTPFKWLGDILVFKSMKKLLGGRFRTGVSGGGALPKHVDSFFQAAGINIVEGYGLTEAGPILSVRNNKAPVPGTVGPLLEEVEYKLLDEHGIQTGPGHKGELHVKSPQIMQGYYKKEEETKKVLSEDGYLNTGDLAVFSHSGPFKIIGRSKETIVLLGGENIEPTPIEDSLRKSSFIKQVMVVGQDQKYLGALIVPDFDELKELAEKDRIQYLEVEELLENPSIIEAINKDVQKLVSSSTGFKTFERVNRFRLLANEFTIGKELTPSMKIKRNTVADLYAREINKIYHV